MGGIKIYICMLLCCFFLQNNTVLIDFFKEIIDSHSPTTLALKKSSDTKAEEEDAEKNEKESKEGEDKEENTEKEKEYKNIKYLNSFTCLSSATDLPELVSSEDSKIFSRDFEIETPPPKYHIFA